MSVPRAGARKFLFLLTGYFILLGGLIWGICRLNDAPRPRIDSIRVDNTTHQLQISGSALNLQSTASLVLKNRDNEATIFTTEFWPSVNDIQCQDNLAWLLCNQTGLVALNLSNPSDPQFEGILHLSQKLWKLTLRNDRAYIACGRDGLLICDISDPKQIRIVTQKQFSSPIMAIETAGELILLSAFQKGVYLYDPATDTIVKEIPFAGRQTVIKKKGTLIACVGKAGAASSSEIALIDIGDPQRPRLLSRTPLNEIITDILIDRHLLFAACPQGALAIWDISDPAHPAERHLSTPLVNVSNLTNNPQGVLALTENGDLYLLNTDSASRPPALNGIKQFGTLRGGRALASHDHFALVSTIKAISIIDLSRTEHIDKTRIFPYGTSHYVCSWHETRNYAIAREKLAFKLFAKRGEKLVFIEETALPAITAGLALSDDDLYVLTYRSSSKQNILHCFKINEKGHVTKIGEHDITDLKADPTKHGLLIHDQRLYINSSRDVRVFSLETPAAPRELPDEKIPTMARRTHICDDRAYLAAGKEGIRIYQLTRGSAPQLLSHVPFASHFFNGAQALDVACNDGILYVACGVRGVLSLDVHDPAQPKILDSFEIDESINELSITENRLFCRANSQSIYEVDISNPARLHKVLRLGIMEDFLLLGEELYCLKRDGIHQLPAPLKLPRTSSANSRQLAFELPENARPGSYELFINRLEKKCGYVGDLTCTAGKEWTFVVPAKTMAEQ
ncbi:MAG: hypothetical protein JXR59_01000 [Desulfuromonadaceae bacterium]|nr:hypothetical protein [Desulfuromonadaceae bacterium]